MTRVQGESPAPVKAFEALTALPDRQLTLNDRQAKVYELLSALSEGSDDFGSWYLGALHALREHGHDHLSQAAHSIREITDKLPTRAGVPMFLSPLPRTKEIIGDILKIRDLSYENGWKGIPITDKLASALESFEELRPIFDATPRTQRMKAALEKKDPYSHGISPVHRRERDKAFREVGEFFQNVAHHNHIPTLEQFKEILGTFESLLISYLSPITGAQQKELLEIIKSPPNHKSENRLNELLRHNGANLVFLLERLDEPLWIPFLERLELFKHPRNGETTNDGGMIYRIEPALTFLARIAPSSPSQVLTILESLPKSDNPQIFDQVMRCLVGIEDIALIPRCFKLLNSFLKRSHFGHWIWFEKLLGVWWRLNAHEEMIEILRGYLACIIKSSEKNSRQFDWELEQIDHKAIAALATIKPLDVAKMSFKALCFWASIEIRKRSSEPPIFQILNDESDAPDFNNPPTYWLEDFSSESIGSHDLERTLARRLYQVGYSIFERGDDDSIAQFDGLLRSNPWYLYTRLRWQLYAEHPEKTLQLARKDTLTRLPMAGSYAGSHGYEMAQMLEKHSEMHRDSFLKPDEVQSMCATIQTGPIDHEGQLVTESSYRESFFRKQLYPIRCLLKGADLDFFNSLFEGTPEIQPKAFKPFSSGGARMIETVPPKKAEEMPIMSDAELWDFLNNWEPNPKRPDPEKWWIEEDVNALGGMFAELLESTPERFPASTEWWKNLTRPSVLFKPLDRATVRISEAATSGLESKAAPTENDWRNWFGLASWITNQRTASHTTEDAVDGRVELEDRTWDWPCMVVVKFLTGAMGSKLELPSDLVAKIGPNLRRLIETSDSRLKNQDKPSMDDWQSTAINSVRGTALEGLLELALYLKRNGGNPDPEEWIFDFIVSRLKLADESPAVFAICGSRLRLLLYLFGDQFKSQPDLLLPADRMKHRNTLLLSHVLYDNPMSEILDVIPSFPGVALEFLSDMNSLQDADRETRGDYGGRLGVHLSFYYWNQSYGDQSTADSMLDRYFITARSSQRAKLIREIANIFEKKSDDPKMGELYDLVRRLWDRRFAQILSQINSHKIERSEVETELSAFINWLDCECFPIEWRSVNVLKAIGLLTKTPHLGNTIKTLERFSADPTRLHLAMEILDALLSKELKEAIWSFREDRIRMILQKALSSASPGTVKLAEGVQETLLRRGLFEYRILLPMKIPHTEISEDILTTRKWHL